jgi:CspA family cold shock protein
MPTGTVKWFNNAKGYGFILPSDSEVDVFAHYSAISMDGYRTLKAGQMVSFDLVDGDKGQHAENIAPVLDPDVEASASEIEEEDSDSDSDSEEPPTSSESELVDAES